MKSVLLAYVGVIGMGACVIPFVLEVQPQEEEADPLLPGGQTAVSVHQPEPQLDEMKVWRSPMSTREALRSRVFWDVCLFVSVLMTTKYFLLANFDSIVLWSTGAVC